MFKAFGTLAAALLLALAAPAQAANVGMGGSHFHTPTLADNLARRGDTVSMFTRLDERDWAALDVFILDGTFDTTFYGAALDAFVYNGGTLIL